MHDSFPISYTSFQGHHRLATGSLQHNALTIKRAMETGNTVLIQLFDDATGQPLDIDLRGSDEEMLARLALSHPQAFESSEQYETKAGEEPRGRGRPKLGVVAREVTLLPRHWEWLSSQPGGASVALRKLVEEARRVSGQKEAQRQNQTRAYHFMSAIGGDLPGFEEASRALFANDLNGLEVHMSDWPADIRAHVLLLAGKA
ncbi:DUF2239 family protein [Leeia aquatica]|uniref:DUF2239 family protein n=1 Tax=Leeia aquatica TaxID=2725557 RepID=A0A847S6F3_9NEIS|nr:DUF2239 family protein [Leeia aquatica]NLR75343.1 DUF2239 family protein [Leeia aquatica]